MRYNLMEMVLGQIARVSKDILLHMSKGKGQI
jgi:hypothetical protein